MILSLSLSLSLYLSFLHGRSHLPPHTHNPKPTQTHTPTSCRSPLLGPMIRCDLVSVRPDPGKLWETFLSFMYLFLSCHSLPLPLASSLSVPY